MADRTSQPNKTLKVGHRMWLGNNKPRFELYFGVVCQSSFRNNSFTFEIQKFIILSVPLGWLDVCCVGAVSSLRRPCIEALRACVRGLSHVHLGWPASGIDMPRTLISRSHDALSASICGSQFFGIDSLVFCNIIQYIPYAFKIP